MPALFGAMLLPAADPGVSPNAWSPTIRAMLGSRSGACAAPLEGGQVLLAGGESGREALSSAEIFDAGGRFQAAAPMASPRANTACAALPDGTVLVAGGYAGGGFSNAVEIYDPRSNAWKSGPSMAHAVAGATVTVLTDGRILLAGGETANGATDALEIFDPQSGTLHPVSARLNSPRARHAAALLADGRVLIAGGWDGARALATADLFDPVSGAVTPTGKLAFARAGLSATTLLDGGVLAAGGSDGQNEQAAAEIFDPQTGRWSVESRMNAPRDGHAAIAIPHNHTVLFVGGAADGPDGRQPLAETEVYIPWRHEFRTAGSLELARTSVAVLALGQTSRIIAAGGRSAERGAESADRNAETFLAPAIFTDKPNYTPGETMHVRGSAWAPGQTLRVSITQDAGGQEASFATEGDASGNWSGDWPMPGGVGAGRIFVTATQEYTAAGGKAVALSARAGAGSSTSTATHFSVSAPTAATAGTSFHMTVTALDASNRIVTGYTGVVHFTSNDPQASLLAYATLTSGAGTFTVTLKTAGSDHITATDGTTSSITGSSSAIGVKAGAAASIAATGGTPQSAVVSHSFTTSLQATVKDLYGNVVSGATLTYQAPSSGASALLPISTLTTNSSGVTSTSATANGVTGSYTVSVKIASGATAAFLLTNLAAAATPQPPQPAQSLQVNGGPAASYSVPASGPYAGLGSFYLDMRVSNWSGPSGNCAPLVQFVTSASYGPSMIDLCDPAYAWGAIRVSEYIDGTSGGSPVWMQAPNIAISSATATNPMKITLAATPFPATMSVGRTIMIAHVAGAGCAGLNGNQTITAASGNTLTLQYNGSACSYTPQSGIALSQDFVFRYHRDLSANQLIGEVWNVDGTGYSSKALGILGSAPVAVPGTFQIGAAGVTANLAFLRWYSGTIPTAAAPPGGVSGGNLADWEFEGNGNDKSGNNLNMSFIGAPTFTASPAYAPACGAGSSQSFRVGQPATLDGTGSFPLDGGTSLTYSWKQIPSTLSGVPLQNLTWASSTTMQPTVTGLTFGPLNFQLTVTQGNGQSSNCVVHHGAVAVDSNSVVIENTGNATLDTAINTLIGPQIRFGANPWPFYDQAAEADAAVQTADMDVDYLDYWDVASPGTVSVSTGSHIVTGTGTSFTTTVCQGPGSPTVPQSNATIIVWYLTGRTVNGAAETGRRRMWVNSCISDTQLNASLPSNGTGWTSDAQAGAGLSYTVDFYTHLWEYGAAPANYYDNVQAYYDLYYRSGIDTYLAAARKLADRFWTSPEIDRGMAFNVGDWFGAQSGRGNEISGMVLRALDTSDGHPDMWAGLHNVWTYTNWLLAQAYPTWSLNGGFDAREYGYTLAQAAYGALWDTDPTWQAYCRSTIETSFQAGAGGVFPKSQDPVQKGWLQWFQMKATFDSGQPWSGATVTLTNGSNLVTCTSGNCGWQPSDFAPYDVNAGTQCSGGATCGTVPVLFTDSANFPADSSHTDAVSYCYPNACTFVDPNHFMLDRTYAGTSGVHGWVFGVSNGSTGTINSGVVGYGGLPYMEGILGWSFDLAAKAMACNPTGGPTNCDNTTSSTAYSYSAQAANWIATYGSVPAYSGLAYFAGFPVCGTSPATGNLWCNRAYTNLQSRELGGDAYRGLAAAYRHSPTPGLKTMLDNWFAGMWAKPGTSPLLPSPDGQYDVTFDPTGCAGCGFYLTDGAPYSQKFFGQHFGISNEGGWPAVRLGY